MAFASLGAWFSVFFFFVYFCLSENLLLLHLVFIWCPHLQTLAQFHIVLHFGTEAWKLPNRITNYRHLPVFTCFLLFILKELVTIKGCQPGTKYALGHQKWVLIDNNNPEPKVAPKGFSMKFAASRAAQRKNVSTHLSAVIKRLQGTSRSPLWPQLSPDGCEQWGIERSPFNDSTPPCRRHTQKLKVREASVSILWDINIRLQRPNT